MTNETELPGPQPSREEDFDRELEKLITKIVEGTATSSDLSRYEELSILRSRSMNPPQFQRARDLHRSLKQVVKVKALA